MQASTKHHILKETALLTGLLFVGLIIAPIAIYVVGQGIFGDYAGHGYRDFFSTLTGKIRSGNIVAWYLILSPYIGWQILRLLALAWRKAHIES